MTGTKHLIRNSYKVMMEKMKKIMKNLEGVGMNTNKILITGLRESHQMNRAKKSYRSMLLSFPTIFLTVFLLLLAFSIPISAENPNSAQWESVGGEMILSGDHKFTTTWTSDRYSQRQGLYWQGDINVPAEKRKYSPWENTVKNSVFPKKGQITVRGPGNVFVFQRSKGYENPYLFMQDTKTKSNFSPGYNSLTLHKGKWDGTVIDMTNYHKTDSFKNAFWGWIPADEVVTLNVEVRMEDFDDRGRRYSRFDEHSFRAPQEIEYELWFFPREGGEVINVIKYDSGANEPDWSLNVTTPLKGQIYELVRNAGSAGEITGEPELSDPTTDKEKIEARLAVIEKLPDKEREKYRDEVAQLYGQLYLVNRHEELDWMLVGGLITVTDKSMGYYTPTALVWGISTGLTTLVMGNYNDGMNRLIGAIPWKNLGTAYSGLLDLGIITPISPGDTGGGTKGGYKRYYHPPQPSYTGTLGVLPPVP